MIDRWYVRIQGREEGPCTFEELFRRVQSGEVSASDKVRNEKSEEWVTVDSIDGLLPEPDTVQDLSELEFTFEDDTGTRPADRERNRNQLPPQQLPLHDGELSEISDLSELNIELVSEDPRPPQSRPLPSETAAVRQPAADSESPAAGEAVGAPHDEEGEWFCQTLGQELGPMSFGELLRLAENGTLQADDNVRRRFGGPWKPAADVPELAASLAAPPPVEPQESPLLAAQAEKPDTQSPADKKQRRPGSAQPEQAVKPEASPRQTAVAEHEAAEQHPPPPVATPSTDGEQAGDHAGDGGSSDEWYCRIDGIEHGPLAFEELQAMAKHGRLQRWHGLKMGERGDWIPAATFPELFSPASPAEQPAASPGQSSGFGQLPGFGGSRPVSTGYTRPPKPTRSKSKAKKVRGPREPVFQNLVAKLGEPKTVVLGFLGIAVAVGVVFAVGFGEFGKPADSYYNELNDIWTQHKALRKRNAPASEWKPLIAKAEKLKAEIVKDLEKGKRASAKRPALQQILWAGRDYLVDMLRTCQKEAGEKEERFARHMQAARELIHKKKSR